MRNSAAKNGKGRPPAVLNLNPSLLAVYGLFEFGPRSEFCDFAGRDFDGRAGLRIAAVARFSLRNGECAEANQGHAISFAEGSGYAFDCGVDSSGGLRLADFTCACDLVNQIGFIHSFSSQVSFVPSLNREALYG